MIERIQKLLKGDDPIRWLFYGDSITHGIVHTSGWRDYPQLFNERVRTELKRSHDLVLNTAISGNTTLNLLEEFDWRVSQFKPDVVFLMIGMNDSAETSKVNLENFEINLNTLGERIEALGAITVYQTTCPILPQANAIREPFFNGYMDVIRRVAIQRNAPLIDHTKFWIEHARQYPYWLSNAFHPNADGHRAFAYFLYRELGIVDPTSRSCNFYFPGLETMKEIPLG